MEKHPFPHLNTKRKPLKLKRMADIANTGLQRGKRPSKLTRIKLDMTPMVDLAFLLLTFFVLTATFTKPKSMEMIFPSKDSEVLNPIKNGITFLISENKLFYYEGEFKSANDKNATQLKELSISSELKPFLIRKYAPAKAKIMGLEKQFQNHQLVDSVFLKRVADVKRDKDNPTILVKADDKASYKNIIDVVDEVNGVTGSKYVMVDMSKVEFELIKAK
jgi:biopolymer transport protein ExbD